MTTDALLEKESRVFAGKVTDLLNGTVANGVRVTALLATDATRGARVASGISVRHFTSKAIPLTIDQKAATGYLDVAHRLAWDKTGRYLMDVRSTYALYRDVEMERPLLRYEYKRDNTPHPEGHLHFIGEFTNGLPAGVKTPRKLHLPLGGRRYRLALEDVIEFLVLEDFAVARPGWEDVIAKSREEYQEIQLQAAVRSNPDVARAVLDSL